MVANVFPDVHQRIHLQSMITHLAGLAVVKYVTTAPCAFRMFFGGDWVSLFPFAGKASLLTSESGGSGYPILGGSPFSCEEVDFRRSL